MWKRLSAIPIIWDWILVQSRRVYVFYQIRVCVLFEIANGLLVGNIVACHAIKPDSSCKGNSILSAAAIVRSIRETVASIDDNPTHWNITVEKYLQMFGASSFRTQGLFYLAEINGIVQYKLWENTGVAPASVHPSTARSTLSIKSAGNRDDTKDVVLAYAQKAVGSSIHWPRKKRSDGLADECFDMADAFVLARYGLIQDKVRSLLALASISPDLQSSIQHSTLFADFVKVHFAHHLRKYSQDDQTISLASLSPEFLEVCNFVWV